MLTTLQERYTDALARRNNFYEAKKDIVDSWVQITAEIEEIDDELRLYCKEHKQSVEAGDSHFDYITRYKKWYDWKSAYVVLDKDGRKRLDEITTVVKTVDWDEFTKLTREGVFPENVRVKAYREEEIAPQVKKSTYE